MRKYEMYAIREPRGTINMLTLHYQRKDSIAVLFSKRQWKTAIKHGWTCKKVRLTVEDIQ